MSPEPASHKKNSSSNKQSTQLPSKDQAMAPKAPPPTIHPPSVPTPKPNVVPPGQPSNANRTPLDAEAEVVKDFVQTLQFKERITQSALSRV